MSYRSKYNAKAFGRSLKDIQKANYERMAEKARLAYRTAVAEIENRKLVLNEYRHDPDLFDLACRAGNEQTTFTFQAFCL